jgi:hypothetical protein
MRNYGVGFRSMVQGQKKFRQNYQIFQELQVGTAIIKTFSCSSKITHDILRKPVITAVNRLE